MAALKVTVEGTKYFEQLPWDYVKSRNTAGPGYDIARGNNFSEFTFREGYLARKPGERTSVLLVDINEDNNVVVVVDENMDDDVRSSGRVTYNGGYHDAGQAVFLRGSGDYVEVAHYGKKDTIKFQFSEDLGTKLRRIFGRR